VKRKEGAVTKFLLLYRAPVSAAEQMASSPPEAAQAGMEAWMAWGERAGSALVDTGSPVQSVSGGSDGDDQIGGYAIMQADSLEGLRKVLEGHPYTEWGGTIEILEFLSLPASDSPLG
jgi:YCII-related domain